MCRILAYIIKLQLSKNIINIEIFIDDYPAIFSNLSKQKCTFEIFVFKYNLGVLLLTEMISNHVFMTPFCSRRLALSCPRGCL